MFHIYLGPSIYSYHGHGVDYARFSTKYKSAQTSGIVLYLYYIYIYIVAISSAQTRVAT